MRVLFAILFYDNYCRIYIFKKPNFWYFADDESGEKTVSVLLAGEESELTFIDHSCAEMTVS